MGARGQAVSAGPSEATIRATLDYLHQKAQSATAVSVTEADAVRPLIEVGGGVERRHRAVWVGALAQ